MPMTNTEFEIKYTLYAQELMNICYGYTKNRDDSLDIIQNVFTKFININKYFKSLDHEKYWLIRVTINECKDYLRKKTKLSYVDEEVINYNIEDNDNNNKELFVIAELVKELPDKYKSVIILFYYDNQSIDIISKALGISSTAVKKRLERARMMLRKGMEGYKC